jgi:hypothetical protein
MQGNCLAKHLQHLYDRTFHLAHVADITAVTIIIHCCGKIFFLAATTAIN